MKSDFS